MCVALWAFSHQLIWSDLNGLETGTAFCMLCVITYFYLRNFVDSREEAKRSSYVALGLLLGMGYLARADLLVLLPVLLLDIFWRRFKREGGRKGFKGMLTAGGSCLLVGLPWGVYNFIVSGSFLASSGQATRFISQAYGYRFLPTSGPEFEIDAIPLHYYWGSLMEGARVLPSVLRGVLPVPAGVSLILLSLIFAFKDVVKQLKRIGFLYLFLAVLFCAYTLYIFGQWHFVRYFTPFTFGYLLLLAISIKSLFKSNVAGKWNHFLRGAVILVIAFGFWEVLNFTNILVRYSGREKAPCVFYEMGRFMDENVGKGETVGVFQSGMVGYFFGEKKFYGLDGKINQSALNAMRRKPIDEYILEKEINYILDWNWVIEALWVKRSRDPQFLSRQGVVFRNRYRLCDMYRIEGKAAPAKEESG